MNDGTFGKGAEPFPADGKAAGVLHCKPPNFAPICRLVRIECVKQPFFAKIIVGRKVFHRASEKAKKHPCEGAFFALAEAARFELADGCPSPHFECGSL